MSLEFLRRQGHSSSAHADPLHSTAQPLVLSNPSLRSRPSGLAVLSSPTSLKKRRELFHAQPSPTEPRGQPSMRREIAQGSHQLVSKPTGAGHRSLSDSVPTNKQHNYQVSRTVLRPDPMDRMPCLQHSVTRSRKPPSQREASGSTGLKRPVQRERTSVSRCSSLGLRSRSDRPRAPGMSPITLSTEATVAAAVPPPSLYVAASQRSRSMDAFRLAVGSSTSMSQDSTVLQQRSRKAGGRQPETRVSETVCSASADRPPECPAPLHCRSYETEGYRREAIGFSGKRVQPFLTWPSQEQAKPFTFNPQHNARHSVTHSDPRVSPSPRGGIAASAAESDIETTTTTTTGRHARRIRTTSLLNHGTLRRSQRLFDAQSQATELQPCSSSATQSPARVDKKDQPALWWPPPLCDHELWLPDGRRARSMSPASEDPPCDDTPVDQDENRISPQTGPLLSSTIPIEGWDWKAVRRSANRFDATQSYENTSTGCAAQRDGNKRHTFQHLSRRSKKPTTPLTRDECIRDLKDLQRNLIRQATDLKQTRSHSHGALASPSPLNTVDADPSDNRIQRCRLARIYPSFQKEDCVLETGTPLLPASASTNIAGQSWSRTSARPSISGNHSYVYHPTVSSDAASLSFLLPTSPSTTGPAVPPAIPVTPPLPCHYSYSNQRVLSVAYPRTCSLAPPSSASLQEAYCSIAGTDPRHGLWNTATRRRSPSPSAPTHAPSSEISDVHPVRTEPFQTLQNENRFLKDHLLKLSQTIDSLQTRLHQHATIISSQGRVAAHGIRKLERLLRRLPETDSTTRGPLQDIRDALLSFVALSRTDVTECSSSKLLESRHLPLLPPSEVASTCEGQRPQPRPKAPSAISSFSIAPSEPATTDRSHTPSCSTATGHISFLYQKTTSREEELTTNAPSRSLLLTHSSQAPRWTAAVPFQCSLNKESCSGSDSGTEAEPDITGPVDNLPIGTGLADKRSSVGRTEDAQSHGSTAVSSRTASLQSSDLIAALSAAVRSGSDCMADVRPLLTLRVETPRLFSTVSSHSQDSAELIAILSPRNSTEEPSRAGPSTFSTRRTDTENSAPHSSSLGASEKTCSSRRSPLSLRHATATVQRSPPRTVPDGVLSNLPPSQSSALRLTSQASSNFTPQPQQEPAHRAPVEKTHKPISSEKDYLEDVSSSVSFSRVTKDASQADSQSRLMAPPSARKKPIVPLLGLREKNVGFGSWLSGEATQGDTYSSTSDVHRSMGEPMIAPA